jgi:membrane protease YdiL (CAAX protease family)
MNSSAPARTQFLAAILALTAALFARAYLQIVLRENGYDKLYAADISYLVVPPILALLLFPVLKQNRLEIRRQFAVTKLSGHLVLSAFALGVLLRLAWWSQLVVGVSFGFYRGDDYNLIIGPAFALQCPPAHVLATGIVVMAILVPIIEEVVHRGLVQSALHRFGPWIAITGSAIVFAVFHPPGNWGFVFPAGVVFGTQYWITRSLWSSLITHATINLLIQFDWRCLRGQWSPRAGDLPLVVPGAVALILLAVLVASILVVLRHMHRGDNRPGESCLECACHSLDDM